jgi:pimeloyl-ACP methyl ester carboxylesterase
MPYATNPGDGVRTYYEVRGEGPPVLLFPPTTGTIATHHDYGWVSALEDRFQLLLVDSRGQGKSEKPHDPMAYTWDMLASDVIAVLDHADIERTHIAGYSTGGLIAFRVAANYPDRVRSIVAGGAQPFATTPAAQADMAGLTEVLRQGSEALVGTFESMAGDSLPPGWRADLTACDTEALIALCQAEIDEAGLSETQVRAIAAPALIYSGDDDEADAGSRAKRAAELMPNATYVELPETDHVQGLLRSEVILPRIRAFLEGIEVQSSEEHRQPTV